MHWNLTIMPPASGVLDMSYLGVGPRLDPGHSGEIISLGWLGNISAWQRGRRSGLLSLGCYPDDTAEDKQKKMGGWMDVTLLLDTTAIAAF